MEDTDNPVPENQLETQTTLDNASYWIWQKVQSLVDRLAIYSFTRWIIALALFSFYVYRAAINQGISNFAHSLGLHVISYFLGLYMLDKFLGFISPKDEEDVVAPGGSILPTRESDEFRPFRRAIKELDLWKSYMAAFILSIALSYLEFLNIPVFWPLLVVYFIMVMIVTFKTKIAHMIKYKYIPMDIGKRTYTKANKGPK